MAHGNGNGPKWFLGGLVMGLAAAAIKGTNGHSSRMDKEEPELTSEVVDHVSELLDELELPGEIESEQEFHQFLWDYLDEHCQYEVESCPSTPFGCPDLLIAGVLALELKVNPKKNERNRLVGQVLDYGRQWRTWIILLDTPESRVQHLENLLDDNKLGHIPVISFS